MGVCEHCKQRFEYYLIHNGFNESAYAYCAACSTTALLDRWKVPKGIEVNWYGAITPGDRASSRQVSLWRCFQCGRQSEMP